MCQGAEFTFADKQFLKICLSLYVRYTWLNEETFLQMKSTDSLFAFVNEFSTEFEIFVSSNFEKFARGLLFRDL